MTTRFRAPASLYTHIVRRCVPVDCDQHGRARLHRRPIAAKPDEVVAVTPKPRRLPTPPMEDWRRVQAYVRQTGRFQLTDRQLRQRRRMVRRQIPRPR